MSGLSIHHNLAAMSVTRNLFISSRGMNKSMEKLSSGFRINTADDGPADLLQSEKLRAQIEGLEKAIQNVTTTRDVMSIAEGGLGQVQNILRDMRKYAIHALNSGVVSADEIAADQAMVDAGMQAIERILGTTSYAGQKLLNKINTGVAHSYDSAAPTGKDGENTPQAANVVATPFTYLRDQLNQYLNGDSIDASGKLRLANPIPSVDENSNILAAASIKIKGMDGGDVYATLDFEAGTSLADIVKKLREVQVPAEDAAKLAGEAAAPPAETPLPADADPSAETEPAGEAEDTTGAAEPQDGKTPTPTLSMFGQTRDGVNVITMESGDLARLRGLDDATLAASLEGFMSSIMSTSEMVKKNGLLNGRKLSEFDQKLLELGNNLKGMDSGTLGAVTFDGGDGSDPRSYHLADIYSWGSASLSKDPALALKIMDQASRDVAMQRAQIGAMQRYSLDAEEENLRTQLVNLQKSESDIRDADYAKEMTEFVRYQILQQTGTQLLSAAMQNGKSILDLMA